MYNLPIHHTLKELTATHLILTYTGYRVTIPLGVKLNPIDTPECMTEDIAQLIAHTEHHTEVGDIHLETDVYKTDRALHLTLKTLTSELLNRIEYRKGSIYLVGATTEVHITRYPVSNVTWPLELSTDLGLIVTTHLVLHPDHHINVTTN